MGGWRTVSEAWQLFVASDDDDKAIFPPVTVELGKKITNHFCLATTTVLVLFGLLLMYFFFFFLFVY